MKNLKYKLTEAEVEFIDPPSEKEGRPKEDWAEGIVYVDDKRIPQELLKKIEAEYGPIPRGSYFTGNFSMYWEKLEPDYEGEVNTGGRSVSNQYRLPNINNVYKQFLKLNKHLDWLKDDKNIMKDKKMQGIFQMIRDAFNAYRTHIRKNYPENYKSLKENEDQMSFINKARAKSSLKQIKSGKRDDGMGKFTAKVYAIKDGDEIEIKNLDDFEKYSTGYKYGLKENVNRDTERSINNFIRKMADEYGYSLQDAVYAIMKVLRDQNYIIPEMSTTGGGAGAAGFTPGEGMGYATPFAFTGGKKAKESKALKDLGYKLVKK
jgi:hypothetical protein